MGFSVWLFKDCHYQTLPCTRQGPEARRCGPESQAVGLSQPGGQPWEKLPGGLHTGLVRGAALGRAGGGEGVVPERRRCFNSE